MTNMTVLHDASKILWNKKRLRIVTRIFLLVTARWLAAVKLKKEANKRCSIKDYVDIAFNMFTASSFIFLSIRPVQVKEEITELLKILARRKPKFLLEIGTARGGTLFLFGRVSSLNAVIISADLPGGRFGGGYREWRASLYKSFAIRAQEMYLVREDSHTPSTLNIIEKILKAHKLDFLFIDGDHTYDGVKKDFELYSKLVSKGGIIALHDIVPGLPEAVGGVPRFWDEIKRDFKYVEFVKNWKQGGAGIGVIYA